MKLLKYSLVFFLLYASNVFAQDDLNQYKYVIVPVKFDFLNEDDQHQLNSLTKFLFDKYGFESYMENEQLPADLDADRCKALVGSVEDLKGGLFKTKLKVNLKNCRGNIVFSTKEGETREKDYKQAYHEALREAFTSFEQINYSYSGGDISKSATVAPQTPKPADTERTLSDTDKVTPNSNDSSETFETSQEEVPSVVVSGIPEIDEIETIEEEKSIESSENITDEPIKPILETLYAQPIAKGFQIVDTTPKKIMILLKTELKDVYLVEGKDAMVFKKDGKWLYSGSGSNLETKELEIKF